MNSSDSPFVQRLCLEGFRYAIKISAQFYMELERDAFVQSLTTFTHPIHPHTTYYATSSCCSPFL